LEAKLAQLLNAPEMETTNGAARPFTEEATTRPELEIIEIIPGAAATRAPATTSMDIRPVARPSNQGQYNEVWTRPPTRPNPLNEPDRPCDERPGALGHRTVENDLPKRVWAIVVCLKCKFVGTEELVKAHCFERDMKCMSHVFGFMTMEKALEALPDDFDKSEYRPRRFSVCVACKKVLTPDGDGGRPRDCPTQMPQKIKDHLMNAGRKGPECFRSLEHFLTLNEAEQRVSGSGCQSL